MYCEMKMMMRMMWMMMMGAFLDTPVPLVTSEHEGVP